MILKRLVNLQRRGERNNKNCCRFLSLLLSLLFLLHVNTQAQQTLINLNGWNAYVHLPASYQSNPNAKYPTIIFFPGIGEVGFNPQAVINYGPGAYLAQGWNGNVNLNGNTVEFLIISLQPSAAFPTEYIMNIQLQALKNQYRIDPKRLYLTGLSHGGWCSSTFVTGDPVNGPYTYASQVAAVVTVQGMRPDDNQPYPKLFDNFASVGGKYLGFEQTQDNRDTKTVVDRMNATVPGSAIYVQTSYGGGSHCCWQEYYGGSGAQPAIYNLDGINQNIYEWMARQSLPANGNVPPTVYAGPDQTITLPTSQVNLNGTANDPNGSIISYTWSQVSGPANATIQQPTHANTVVKDLVQGQYLFALTVVDNDGASASDTLQVTVNSNVNNPPTANAGPDLTITLPTNTATLSGSGTDTDGTITEYSWSQVSGPSSANLSNANAATATAANLVQGTYIFELTVTDNNGATAKDAMQVIVNPAPQNNPPTANAGPDVTVTLPTNTAALSGSGTDTDGTITGYSWSQVSGPSSANLTNANAATATANNLVQGTYVFELTVTDNNGATAKDAMQVIVNAAPQNNPPTANAGPDVTITLPTNTATLSGSGTDTDGTITGYSWSQVSGPSSANLTNANAATATANNLIQGTYVFELTVTDNNGAMATDAMQVIVNATQNNPPTANAGPDLTITLPNNTATLSGSGTDTDGTITGYSWAQVSGPSSANFSNANAATATAANLVQGTYIFELTVTDNNGATAKDAMQVIVSAAPQNNPPTANAGPDVTITLPTNTATLSGSGTDTDGTITGYSWSQVSGPSSANLSNANTATALANNLVAGTYVFELTVTDNNGATAKDAMQVFVNTVPNNPPTANAGPDVTITLPTNTATLSGSGTDTDGTITGYSWAQVSGPSSANLSNANAATATANNLVAGTYIFELTVTDNNGATAKDAMQVIVNPAPNNPPTVNAGPDVTITLPTNTATLAGSGTHTDGTITGYSWSQVSGPSSANLTNANAATATANNLVQGTYVFELTVTDNNGATAKDAMQVIVTAAPQNNPPTANAGPDLTITLPTNTATLSGSGTDTDGTITGYSWSQVSGPSSANLTNANAATATANNLIQGTYVFELTVTDNNGAMATDAMQVIVNATQNNPPTANAGPDLTITLPNNTAALSGSGTDTDGTITGYSWSQVSGPSSANLSNANAATATAANLVQGTYIFELTVSDNNGATATDAMQVIVNATQNNPPTANAGPDLTITLPTNTATLSGSGSDTDGTITGYSWSQVSGPSSANLSNANAGTATAANLVQGTYIFELTVTDNNGATAKDAMQVIVNAAPQNNPPTANAGPDVTITLPANTATLAGSGTDTDGTITGYSWSQVSGPSSANLSNANSATATAINLVAGTYVFELTVTDNNGATATDAMQVIVTAAPQNNPPTANAGPDLTITLPANTATLAGSGTDTDGNITGFSWSQVSGPSSANFSNANAATATAANLVQGTYVFELSVTDNNGATAKDAMQVFVNAAPNNPPTANAGPDVTITLPTNTATLAGSGTDTDGTITGYSWSQVSGPSSANLSNATTATASANNLIQGTYIFELTVTDNNGATAKDAMQVMVNAAPQNVSPTANAGPDIIIVLPIDSALLTGSGSDPDGSVTAYQWQQIAGPTTAHLSNANAANASVGSLKRGLYRFELTVTDNHGAHGRDTMEILVNGPANIPPTANAGPDMVLTYPTGPVQLSGSGSDPDGFIASFSWSKIAGLVIGDLLNANTATPTINNLTPGYYYYQLTVTDNEGATARDTVKILVNMPVNVPPTVNAGADQVITLPTNAVYLSGTAQDSDGSIVSHRWRKLGTTQPGLILDTTASATAAISLVQGIYYFEFTATDNRGATVNDTMQVTVKEAPNQPPVAIAGTNTTVYLPQDSIRLAGVGIDPDGSIVSYKWSVISAAGTFHLTQPNSAATTLGKLQQGVYTLRFTVTDNKGATASDTINISVGLRAVRDVKGYVEVYPNPVHTTLNAFITSPVANEILVITIVDERGIVHLRRSSSMVGNSKSESFDFSSYPPGIYYLECVYGNRLKVVKKVIKQ